MKSQYLGVKESKGKMAEVTALLDGCGHDYVLLYDDGGGTHVVESELDWRRIQSLLTAALMIVSEGARAAGAADQFGDWLSRFVEFYAKDP